MLMKSKSIYKLVNLCFLLVVFFSSCSKMNDKHDEYLQRGETIYVGKPDSVKVLAGKERVKFRFWSSDPKAAKLAVYWLSRTDSVIVDIPAHLAKDSLEFIIPNLPEYNYSFELVSMNKDFKNRSVTFQANGSSYGEKFQSSLVNRVIESSIKYPAYLEIKWLGAVEKGIGSELKYVNTLGKNVTLFVPMTEKITTITDLVGGINYRTSFLPTLTSIDTFYTVYKQVPIESLMDKTMFKRWNPTGIPYSQLSATYAIEKLWDNSLDAWFITNTTAFPHSFTFDLGQTKKLTSFKHWQRLTITVLYRIQNVKKFELWGSATPNVTADFAGWVKLGDYASVKPSGLPVGTESTDDINFATAGENFRIYPTAPPVRYIRYVVTEAWSGLQTVAAVGEMTFYEEY